MRIIAAALFLGVLASAPGFARAGDVSLAGRVILRVRFAAAGYSVAQRTHAIQTRLIDVLSMGQVSPEDVRVGVMNKETAILVKDQLFITVDWTTAWANKTTPEKLGKIWAENLRNALPEAMPRRSDVAFGLRDSKC